MSIDNQPFEEFQEVVDQCIERMLAGETIEQVLASHPRYSASLAPVLCSASVLLSANPPEAFAVQRARTEARMLDEVAAAPAINESGGTIMSWLTSFKSRPALFQAGALAAGVLMFGALGIGGAAATGNTPDPVRNLFNSSSEFNVEFTGVITAVEGDQLVIEAGGDTRTVTIADGAEISRDGDDVSASELTVGSIVEVKGTLQPDNTILASRLHLEDDDDADENEDDEGEDQDGDDESVTAVPDGTATAAPVVVPTIDDDDDCDNSGTGSPCDDDNDVDDGDVDDEDNSGPGSGDDDGANDDSSEPGSGDDDGANGDDSSGPGSGGDDDEVDDDD